MQHLIFSCLFLLQLQRHWEPSASAVGKNTLTEGIVSAR